MGHSFQSQTIFCDSNIAFKTLCENIEIPSQNATVTILSDFKTPTYGCLGFFNYSSPWFCVSSGLSVKMFDFCDPLKFKLLPNAGYLYSMVETGSMDPLQNTSFSVSIISSGAQSNQEFQVSFSLVNMTKWFANLGNYDGGYERRDCNINQHIQIITWDNSNVFSYEPSLSYLNFECSDGARYFSKDHTPEPSRDPINCTTCFGINGIDAYIGSSGSIIGAKFKCGSIQEIPIIGQTLNTKVSSYECKHGHIVTGLQYYYNMYISGVGLTCSPINLNVSFLNLFYDKSGALSINSSNIEIRKSVGNIDYLELSFSIDEVPLNIMIDGILVSKVLFKDLMAFGVTVIMNDVPSGKVLLKTLVNTNVNFNISLETQILVPTIKMASNSVSGNLIYLKPPLIPL